MFFQVFRLVSLWFSLSTKQIIVNGMLSTIEEVKEDDSNVILIRTYTLNYT